MSSLDYPFSLPFTIRPSTAHHLAFHPASFSDCKKSICWKLCDSLCGFYCCILLLTELLLQAYIHILYRAGNLQDGNAMQYSVQYVPGAAAFSILRRSLLNVDPLDHVAPSLCKGCQRLVWQTPSRGLQPARAAVHVCICIVSCCHHGGTTVVAAGSSPSRWTL